MGLGKLFKGKAEAKKGQKLRPVINRQTNYSRSLAAPGDKDISDVVQNPAEMVGLSEQAPEAAAAVSSVVANPVPETEAIPPVAESNTAADERPSEPQTTEVVSSATPNPVPETEAMPPAAESNTVADERPSGPETAEVVGSAAANPVPEKKNMPPASGSDTIAEERQPAPEQAARTKITNMIYKTVCKGCQTQRGVHVETALSSLGALAGFGCQMAVREGMIKPGLLSADAAFTVAETADGRIYYYGDMLDQPLFEAPVSVYSIIRAGITRAGGGEDPDVDAIVGHVADTLGGEAFGVLSVPKKHQPLITPLESLKRFWPALFAQIRPYYADKTAVMVEPTMLGWLFAEAAQRLIVEAKNIVPPPVSGSIAFEAAVMMSKGNLSKFIIWPSLPNNLFRM